MTDARLFPGWDTMLWPLSKLDGWGSTTPGWLGLDVPFVKGSRAALREQCREYSTFVDGPILMVYDGEIVAEWWRGGRFAPRDSYA
jgi:hypothetical protein